MNAIPQTQITTTVRSYLPPSPSVETVRKVVILATGALASCALFTALPDKEAAAVLSTFIMIGCAASAFSEPSDTIYVRDDSDKTIVRVYREYKPGFLWRGLLGIPRAIYSNPRSSDGDRVRVGERPSSGPRYEEDSMKELRPEIRRRAPQPPSGEREPVGRRNV